MDYHRPMSLDESRRMSLATGVMWLITFATSIPALWLYQPVLDDPVGYVSGGGDDNRIFLACFLELLLIISNIATAVIPYPLLKRQHEGCALGFVAARIMESTFILAGILAVLTVVGLRTDPPAGISQDTLGSLAYTFAALKDWTFLLGPGFVVGVGNGLLFGYLMYKSGLVPPRMALLGLVGGPLLIASAVAVMFDVAQPGGSLQGLCTIPEALWELLVGLYFTFKGFRPEARILRGDPPIDPGQPSPTVVPAT
jgi:uncharacterized protein DUF4386